MLSHAVGLENLEAASVHSRFIKELLKTLQDDLAQDPAPDQTATDIRANRNLLWNFFKVNGGFIIQGYFSALLDVPPKQVAEVFTDTVGILCVTFMEEGQLVQGWLAQAVQTVPINVLTLENKHSMVNTVADAAEFRLSRLMYELNLMAKRARSSAIRS